MLIGILVIIVITFLFLDIVMNHEEVFAGLLFIVLPRIMVAILLMEIIEKLFKAP